MPHDIPFSPEEIELLEIAKNCEEFANSSMWNKLQKFMDGMVEELETKARGNRSSNPVISHNLNLKLRERELMKDRLVNFVMGPIAAKKQILRDLEEMNYARPNA